MIVAAQWVQMADGRGGGLLVEDDTNSRCYLEKTRGRRLWENDRSPYAVESRHSPTVSLRNFARMFVRDFFRIFVAFLRFCIASLCSKARIVDKELPPMVFEFTCSLQPLCVC